MKRRYRASSIVGLIVALLIVLAQQLGWLDTARQTAQNTQPGLYKVVNFDDGDTLTVDMNGRNETIRFIGLDTPEIHDPRKPVQCFGRAASEFTKNLVGTNQVRLESDPLSTNRDRYNRLLRFVYLPDNTLVNAEVIKQGYGFAVTGFPNSKMDEFKRYETEAREQSRGLWKDCQPYQTDQGYYQSNDAP